MMQTKGTTKSFGFIDKLPPMLLITDMPLIPKAVIAEIMILTEAFVVWMSFDVNFARLTLLLFLLSLDRRLVPYLDNFFFVLVIKLPHASWTSYCSFWNLPVMVLFDVEVERRRTRVVSAATTLKYPLGWEYLSVDLS
jgi:hypothetical protein